MRGDLALSPFWKEFALVLLNILKGPHHLVQELCFEIIKILIYVYYYNTIDLIQVQSTYTFFQFRLYHTVVLCAWRFTAALEVAWPRNGESQNGSAKSMLRPPPWGHGLIRHFSLKILIVKSVKMQPWWWTKGFSSRYVVICFMVAKAAAAKFCPKLKSKKNTGHAHRSN